MTKAQLDQILVATTATIIAGIALDMIRNKQPKQERLPPPVADSSPWYQVW